MLLQNANVTNCVVHRIMNCFSGTFPCLHRLMAFLYFVPTPARFPMLSPLASFRSLPRLCPHQSHLHTISGLSGLAPRHGYRCSRCSHKKWPPVLIPPLDPFKDPLKPLPTLILPSLNTSTDQQKSPLLDGVCADTHHTQSIVPNIVQRAEVKEKTEGEVTVLSVGR